MAKECRLQSSPVGGISPFSGRHLNMDNVFAFDLWHRSAAAQHV